MKRIASQCYKELAQFQRDRLTLALACLLPFMTLIIFGFAIRLEAKNIPLYIRDLDLTPLSRSYSERLFATDRFIPVNSPSLTESSLSNPQELIDRGIAKVAVIILPDFSRRIKSGSTAKVQAIVDGSDVNNARVIKNIISATTISFLRQSGLQPTSRKIIARVRLWFNPGRKESLYIVPGIYGLVLWIFPSLLSAVATVREKVQGTIVQVYASNLTATELILGKALAYLSIGILEAILLVGCGVLILGLSFAGDPTPLIIGTIVFLTDAILFGILIGSRAANQSAAIQAVALIGFLTALLLSGFIYPLSNIPFPLSLISYIIPARYYIEITRDAFVRGTGWTGVGLSILALLFLGFLIFQAARKKLHKMQLSA
jgi:ABC-2 type transport system permease protein